MDIKKLPQSSLLFVLAGLMFEFFDYRVNGIDLIFDTLGVVLVLIGLFKLATANRSFFIARNLKFVQLPLAIALDFNLNFEYDLTLTLLSYLFFTIFAIVSLYFLCKGIAISAAKANIPELSVLTMERYLIFVLLSITNFMFKFMPDFTLIADISLIIAYVLILALIYRAKLVLWND